MTHDPHERRDWFVKNTVKSAKEAGIDVDPEAVQRAVARDLDTADKFKAENPPPPAKADAEAREQSHAKRRHAVEEFAAQRDSQLFEKPLPKRDRPLILPPLSGVDEERRLAMLRRLQMICQPEPGRTLKPGESFGTMFRAPKLVDEIFMHSIGFSRGVMSYVGLSYEDRQRKFTRAIEDICDRSNAVFGVNWWVK